MSSGQLGRQVPGFGSGTGLWRATTLAGAIATLVACGGGGGGSGGGSTSQPTETPSGTTDTPPDTPIVLEALPAGTRALNLSVDERMADPEFVRTFAEGETLTAWNPRNPKTTLVPGLKIGFFGRANGCAVDASDGPVTGGDDTDFTSAASLSGLSTGAVTVNSRWMPMGASPSCDAGAQSRTGPSWVFVNSAASGGGIGLYTPVGPQSDGKQPFIGAFGNDGVDGQGSNSNGLGTFVTFRKAWNGDTAIRPWVDSRTGLAGAARIVSRQSIGSLEAGSAQGGTVQVKQQLVVSLINTTCWSEGRGVSGPCQIQYLFNTAIARSGVTDWESHQPSSDGRVWFDKVQGTMPVVAGLVPVAGNIVSDTTSGLPLYRSAGAATLHQAAKNTDFDLRISFEQLKNAARIVAASKIGVAAADLSDTEMTTVWGSAWADPAKWTLVAAMVGQESYSSAYQSKRGWIGGGFSSYYVGPER